MSDEDIMPIKAGIKLTDASEDWECEDCGWSLTKHGRNEEIFVALWFGSFYDMDYVPCPRCTKGFLRDNGVGGMVRVDDND